MKMLCPHCGVKGTADESYIGKMVKCPQCEAAFEVLPDGKKTLPEDEQTQASLSPLELEQQGINELQDGKMLKMVCPHCGVQGSADGSYVGKMVKCPKCEAAFKVFPEGEIPSTEDLQTPAFPVDLETQDSIESSDEVTKTIEDGDGPAAEIPAEYVLENELTVEPEDQKEQEEVLDWSDIPDDVDQELVYVDEIAEIVTEESLEEPELPPSDERKDAADTAPVLGPDVASTLRARGFQGNDPELTAPLSVQPDFSITGVIKDAWEETKGAKASIWAGSCVMYLVMLIIGVTGTFLMPVLGLDLMTTAGMVTNVAWQVLLTVVSIVFTAGLLYMGVRKAAGDPVDWKMIFKGFSFTGQIILATVLQTILVSLGLLLLVLPGIYLIVGYGLTLPLIVDRKMSAWEAMETSRKAIHKVWWKVAGALFLMGCIYTLSTIPLGIGLIWTVPMFIVLGGIVYRYLFGVGENN